LTDEQLKELAEFGAEFLGCPTDDKGRFEMPFGLRMKWWDLVGSFFNEKVASPALAHLAKREMEKRGFTWECFGWEKRWKKPPKQYCYRMYWRPDPDNVMSLEMKYANHENEYIALWLAIREAVKG